jgi:GNAT superfamily N-acetyltransferase
MNQVGRDRSAAQGGSFSVRQLTSPSVSEDEALAEIFNQYRVHYGEIADVGQSARWLQENIGGGRLRAFVAEDRARLVGFATTIQIPASLRLSHSWQIRDLFVLPQHRRLGIGRALLGAVQSAAAASGALRLVLQTEEENDPALGLYAETGFVPVPGYRALTLPLD